MSQDYKEVIKRQAAGQWKSILQSVGGFTAEQLNGIEQPCPKPECSGNTRFRLVDEEDGAVLCSHCLPNNCGDGIAAIMWMLGIEFGEALEKIGRHLGIEPKSKKSIKKKPIKKKPKSKKVDPAEKLEFRDWNDIQAAMWCQKKQPIKPADLLKVGARMAIYRGEHKVIALPVWSKTPDNIVGWSLYNVTGGTLPAKGGEKKVKLTYGSKAGIIGVIGDSAKVYKSEGPSDMLALMSIVGGASVICNANGAGENPTKKEFDWLPDLLDGKEIRVIHDADKPGQDGAIMVGDQPGRPGRPGWATWLASKCEDSTVKNLTLPYPIEATSGKDVRDWISEGHDSDGLEKLAGDVEPIEAVDIPDPEPDEAEDIELKGINDFIRDNPTMREEMIEGLLRRGETANVIASTKVGKSWLAIDLALSVAAGTKWLKRLGTTKGVVAYVDLELHSEVFADRLREISKFREHNLQAMNENFMPICLRGTGHDIDSLESVIDQIQGKVDLIILDAWYRLIPEGVSENDNAQMMAMYNRLDAYAKQCNAAIVVIHHSSKGEQGTKRVTDVGSGAGSISRAADTHIVIREHVEEGQFVLDAACRSFARIEPFSMFFTWPCWHVSQTEVALKSRTSRSEEKQKIEDAKAIQKIKNSYSPEEEFSANDVRTLLSCSRDRAGRILTNYSNEFEHVGFRPPGRKNAPKQEIFKLKANSET